MDRLRPEGRRTRPTQALRDGCRRLCVEVADLALVAWMGHGKLGRHGIIERHLLPARLDQRGGDLPGVALVPGLCEVGKRIDRADQPGCSKRH